MIPVSVNWQRREIFGKIDETDSQQDAIGNQKNVETS